MEKALAALMVCMWLLISVPPALADTEEELWENKAFAEKAQAIKKSNWDKVGTRDLAIVMLFELGRKADAMESDLRSRSDRVIASVSNLLWIGGGLLAAYLVLQLAMTLFMVTRLGRLEKAAQPQRRQGTAEDFDL